MQPILIAALSLGLAGPLVAQVDPVHRLFSPLSGTDTHLVDDQGVIIHTWPSSRTAGNTVYVEDDGTLLRCVRTGVQGAGGGTGGGVERLALDGTLLWSFDYDTGGNIHHHDAETLPNGNVLLIAWETKTQAEAIQAGRDPSIMTGPSFFPDHIVEVEPSGATGGSIVWEWHVWDHLIQDFDATKDNFGNVGANPQLIDINFPPNNQPDFNHANSIDYDPEHDWIVLSANFQDEFWIIDHSTTTAEAAGHTGGDRGKGGDLLYRWGNPQAYGAGTGADKDLFRQHGVKFIDAGLSGAGNVILFNNQLPGGSRVEELVLPVDGNGDFVLAQGAAYGPAAPQWSYDAPDLQSNIMSSADRLPNGNTLVCSSLQGRLFEITDAGSNVWEIATGGSTPPTATFHATHVARTLWSDVDSVSQSAGGGVALDLMAGSAQAGQTYFVLGSITGTSPGITKNGVNLPLEFDPWTDLTLLFPNTPLFTNSLGTLDANGRATASFNVTPGLLPTAGIGVTIFHAAVAVNPGTSFFTWASNPVATVIEP